MLRVAADGKARVSELEVLVEANAWTVRARLDGSARQVALLIPIPGKQVEAHVVEPDVLDRLDFATAPRMKVFSAKDPCSGETAIGAPGERPDERVWPARKTEAPGGFTAKVVAPSRAAELMKLLPGLTLDPDSARTLARAVRDGSRLVLLTGRAPGKLRGFWTPPVRATTKSKTLPLGLAAPHITVGKTLRLELFAADGLRPDRTTANLPSGVNLPEVTLEDPLDLYGAVALQTIRREGEGTAVRVFEGSVGGRPMTRHFMTLGRRDDRVEVTLVKREATPFSTEWSIRRVWRKPIACEAKTRYLNNVRIQQKTEIQTYAALTGRPQRMIQDLQRARGYLLVNGALQPIVDETP